MTERLSDEMASLLDEGEHRLAPAAARALLRARLAMSLSEGLTKDAGLNGHAGDHDHALLAAYLDGTASAAEREAMMARLAEDPAARSELAAAMALLDDIEARPEEPPAALLARAAEIFTPEPVAVASMQAGGGWMQTLIAASRWHPAAKFGMATAMLLLVATPIIVPMISEDGNQGAAHDSAVGDGPVGRSFPGSPRSVEPVAADIRRDARGCEIDGDKPAVAGQPADTRKPLPAAAPPKPKVDGAAVHSTPPLQVSDPCARKPGAPPSKPASPSR
jgi:hypothetical protein